jgi:hypothetical protein
MKPLEDMKPREIYDVMTTIGRAVETAVDSLGIGKLSFCLTVFDSRKKPESVTNCDLATTIEVMRKLINALERRQKLEQSSPPGKS